jgi:thioredoxin-like negative regulator of GroEL
MIGAALLHSFATLQNEQRLACRTGISALAAFPEGCATLRSESAANKWHWEVTLNAAKNLLMKILVSIVAVLVIDAAPAFADSAVSKTSLDEVLKTASREHKAILIEFGASWCEACKKFDRAVIGNWRVQRALKEIMFVRYDVDDIPGNEAASRYSVNIFPTYLAVDASGFERFRRTSSELRGPDGFIDLVSETKALVEDDAVARERLKEGGNDAQVRLAAARWYAARKQFREAIHELDAVTKSKISTSEKRDASRLADHLRRVVVLKEQLVNASVKRLRADYSNASLDDLIIATLGSGLPKTEIRNIFRELFKAHGDDEQNIEYVYVAIAAGLTSEALAKAETLAQQNSDAERVALLAECKYANGDREGGLEKLDEAILLAKGSNKETEAKLKLDRARIDAGNADASEVVRFRLMASNLWQRLETVDQLGNVPTPNPGSGGLLSVIRAVHKLGVTTAAKCTSKAAGAKRVVATLNIDNATGQVVSSTLYMEDTTNQELRKCIETELASAKLPIIEGSVPVQDVNFNF